MKPSTPASAGQAETGDVSSLTEAKARMLAEAWISAMNRIPHFTPEPSDDGAVQRAIFNRAGSGPDLMGLLVKLVHPLLRRRGMTKAAREVGVSKKHVKELLRRFDLAWSRTRELTYEAQVRAIAAALARS